MAGSARLSVDGDGEVGDALGLGGADDIGIGGDGDSMIVGPDEGAADGRGTSDGSAGDAWVLGWRLTETSMLSVVEAQPESTTLRQMLATTAARTAGPTTRAMSQGYEPEVASTPFAASAIGP